MSKRSLHKCPIMNDLGERLEETGESFLLHADASVAAPKLNLHEALYVIDTPEPHSQLNFAFISELDRVGDEVVNDLSDALRVAHDSQVLIDRNGPRESADGRSRSLLTSARLISTLKVTPGLTRTLFESVVFLMMLALTESNDSRLTMKKHPSYQRGERYTRWKVCCSRPSLPVSILE